MLSHLVKFMSYGDDDDYYCQNLIKNKCYTLINSKHPYGMVYPMILNELRRTHTLDRITKIYVLKDPLINFGVTFTNAFNKKKAYLTLTTGDLKKLNLNEIRAGLGHELGHLKLHYNPIYNSISNVFRVGYCASVVWLLTVPTALAIAVGLKIINHTRLIPIIMGESGLAITATIGTFVLLYLRQRHTEKKADLFSSKLTSDTDMINLLDRASKEYRMHNHLNKFEALTDAHTSLRNRIYRIVKRAKNPLRKFINNLQAKLNLATNN